MVCSFFADIKSDHLVGIKKVDLICALLITSVDSLRNTALEIQMSRQIYDLYRMFLNGYRIGDESTIYMQVRKCYYNEWSYIKNDLTHYTLWAFGDFWIIDRFKI